MDKEQNISQLQKETAQKNRRQAFRIFFGRGVIVKICTGILILFIAVSLLAPLISPHDPNAQDLTNEFGTFYRFQVMSYLPFERELIDVEMLHPDEIEWIDQYHQICWENLSPYMNQEEKEALREATAPLQA